MKKEDDGSFVIPSQPLTEVFWNEGGGITVKQVSFCEEDTIATFTRRGVRDLIEALESLLSQDERATPERSTPQPPAPEPTMERPAKKKGGR